MTDPLASALDRIKRARVPGRSGFAFDADGTLWAGDVSEDVFEFACSNELLMPDAHDALIRVASEHGLDSTGSPSRVAATLFAAYRRGVVQEVLMCEIMAWSYAGFTTDALAALAREVLERRGLRDRARRLLDPFFDYARREGVRTVVITASPKIIVTEGLRLAGVEVDELGAAGAVIEGGVLRPALDGKVPYGPEKPVIGARLLDGHDWLAAFGDNIFDLEMLRSAKIGCAVCPKPALRARLSELPNTIVLE